MKYIIDQLVSHSGVELAKHKRRLRHEHAMLENLLNRYGNINLWDVHDLVSVELDYYRDLSA